jgi:sialic acid synthase SpsE
MRNIRIGNKLVGEGQPAFIIAEAGINHQGEMRYAKQLIDIAVFAGADAVKFQKRKVERILTREGLDMPYANDNSFGKTYGEHKRVLELSDDDYYELKRYAEDKGIIFLASAWDEESADFLEELGVPAFKIASADMTNTPLLEHIAAKGKPIIISTGMSTMSEVEQAVNAVRKYNKQLALLQCTSTYPCQFGSINLRVMLAYKEKFSCIIGYSGHELGISIPPVAVALGAKIIERHFTIDRTMKGSDHAASLEPGGLQKMIRDIRHTEAALGSSDKRLLEEEAPIRKKLAKSLVSTVAIPKGSIISRSMLTTKGPGTGISPARMDEVIGKRAARDLDEDVVIHEEDIEW